MADALRESIRDKLESRKDYSLRDVQVLDLFFKKPVSTISDIAEKADCSFPTARKVIEKFEGSGLLIETTGMRRNKRFLFKPYVDLFK